MRDTFSRRHGFASVEEAEITIREDAPGNFRGYLIQLAYECGLKPSDLRYLICRALKKQPDPSNWSEYPNVDNENGDLLQSCKWYKIYDIVECLDEYLANRSYNRDTYEHYQTELNEYFIEEGIGWKLVDGRVEVRGPESFEIVLKAARDAEREAGYNTASSELHQAISDLSRRPTPDVSGAIQHSMASLECVARQITGNPKDTLGTIMNDNRSLIPVPLDLAVIKTWAYASEFGRHLREGREPTFDEAELVVGLCASVSNYLIKKAGTS
ncbi:hypothetical protein SAMN05216577_116111 [Pseudomonas citronellolis]|uniref:HEPN AbiJ-N-terminal domain-containing protein n=1 Tax=Pseudomonas citronellolis TaxID=53408 RepID=A0AAQ1HP53_9PSED|nr:hypothetical protein [Pseudomonas citronellolis]TGC30049.1 hypothetical protein CW310_08640 [Pseudomonas citronellolis]SFD09401.1 hypothetical protein SAMN05216577_116111 [Pseudomonas citronellolis]